MDEIILSCRDISREFQVKSGLTAKGGVVKAVDRVSLELMKGEILGVAGESGCGKSTLAKILSRLLKPTSGDLYFEGKICQERDWAGLDSFRQKLQMVFQDPYSSLNPRMRIGEIIAEPIVIRKAGTTVELRREVKELMELVGLPPDKYFAYPHEFSGGQRQRIGIARALAVKPQVLIADEPLSALDISIQAQIINLMLDLRKQFGLSYILISHDLSVIRHMCHRVAVMYLGRVVELGAAESLFSRPLHPYSDALIASIPGMEKSGYSAVYGGDIPSPLAPPTGCHFHPRCPYKQEICCSVSPELEDKGGGQLAACHFPLLTNNRQQ